MAGNGTRCVSIRAFNNSLTDLHQRSSMSEASVARSVRWALALMAANAFAQDAVRAPNESSNPAETDRVIVTGSYIPTQTAAEVGPNPVQVVDRYTIEKSGERNTERLLRNLSVGNANGISPSGIGGGVNAEGAASISLRGLD